MLLPQPNPVVVPTLVVSLLLTACAQDPATISDKSAAVRRSAADTWQARPEVYENKPISDLREPVDIQTGRYTYLSAKPLPEQINPLLTLIDVLIPEGINTVSASATYLLQFSGYQLSQTVQPEPQVLALLRRTIPEVHRHFEQVVLRDALLALCGNGFRLVVDPVNRSLAFERDPNYAGWTAP
jgi:conjugative transfer region protein (TIGR03748 family)